MKFFRRKKPFEQIQGAKADPTAIVNPTTAADFRKRGWAYHARGQYTEAEADFRKALELAPDDVETLYALGLCLKQQERANEAAEVFRQVVSRLENVETDDALERARVGMLHRLALGHVNELTKGDWDLEKEIWQHV